MATGTYPKSEGGYRELEAPMPREGRGMKKGFPSSDRLEGLAERRELLSSSTALHACFP